MDIPAPDFRQPASTPPKLSLFSLPFKHPTLPDTGVTPPLNTAAAAIPFLWEEAPGKPRPIISGDPPKSKTVRSLDLPPRLASLSPAYNNGNNHRDKFGNNAGMEIIPSPTTVLGGPYEGLYASNLALESSEKVNKSKEKISMPLRKLMKERSPVRSWRWDRDGFRDSDEGRGDISPPVRFCSWRWDSFMVKGGGGGGRGGGEFINSGGKIGKVVRRNSFTFDNGSTSRFLATMYGNLKQAMPWRSRR
ncbi:hypothetical protein R6Q59_036956 [Mikania micrantha]